MTLTRAALLALFLSLPTLVGDLADAAATKPPPRTLIVWLCDIGDDGRVQHDQCTAYEELAADYRDCVEKFHEHRQITPRGVRALRFECQRGYVPLILQQAEQPE